MSRGNAPALLWCAVGKNHGKNPAIGDLNLKISLGESVALLGLNGAGKSTSLRLGSGAMRPDTGRIEIFGQNLVDTRSTALAQIGYLPEAAALPGEWRVDDFLRQQAWTRGLFGPALAAAAKVVVARCDLAAVLTQRIGKLSKGLRRRVALAAALIGDPPILLLDEPTDGLDPAQKSAMWAIVKTIAPQKAILWSTHFLDEAAQLCPRWVILHHGRIVYDGPAPATNGGEFFHHYTNAQVAA